MSNLKTAVTKQDHQTGHPDAKIVLVEYGDYQCPHCGIAYPFIKLLLKKFESELLFVFRNFPLQEIHPAAMPAALAAEAADKQNKFWEMHDIIFENQRKLTQNSLLHFAETLNLDLQNFAQDWKSEETFSKVESDFESGIRSGVNGTPTFFLNGLRVENYDETYESLANALKNIDRQETGRL